MKILSDIMLLAYRNTGSVNGYLHTDRWGRNLEHRNLIPSLRWTQLWFLMREILKKEGVHAPRFASTISPEVSHGR
ncbi:MAG: hypothetical protein EBR40_10930 [Proteobacteria bacterium]|nr:hypothetical protein [Pseudomonadota bacterium]